MTTLWQTTTDNSTLPVQPGNNWWEHLHNQNTGGGPIDGGRADIELIDGGEAVTVSGQFDKIAISDDNTTIEIQDGNEAIEI